MFPSVVSWSAQRRRIRPCSGSPAGSLSRATQSASRYRPCRVSSDTASVTCRTAHGHTERLPVQAVSSQQGHRLGHLEDSTRSHRAPPGTGRVESAGTPPPSPGGQHTVTQSASRYRPCRVSSDTASVTCRTAHGHTERLPVQAVSSQQGHRLRHLEDSTRSHRAPPGTGRVESAGTPPPSPGGQHTVTQSASRYRPCRVSSDTASVTWRTAQGHKRPATH